MDADRILEVKELFLAVVELPAAERGAWLAAECGDPALRSEVELLLAADPGATRAVDTATDPSAGGDDVPATIGPYRILRLLGEGGMGAVFLAEQQEPVRRRVAIKWIKQGMDTKEVIARFQAERQALAMMNDPNIATVLDAGTAADGRPYFAMEYVRGMPITDYCRDQRVGLEERIRLFQQVCRGVQHAHQKGVIHRDLKPNNVLVEVRGSELVPKIIDFGIAKAIGEELVEQTLFTEHGQLIGTPEYMSPEQADASGVHVDTRTDIYSLGVLLYQLLTDRLPFDTSELRAGGLLDLYRRIREVEPQRPSTRVTTLGEDADRVATSFGTDRPGLRRALRGDLDWITLRCLEKDPARRYETASELAADLQRHLDCDPVDAGPPSTSYRVAKFLRKRRGPVAAAVALVLALTAGTVISLWQARIARAAESEERATAEQLSQRTDEFERLKGVVLLERARDGIAELDPAWPGRLPAIEAWLDKAGQLVAVEKELKTALDELRQRAMPWTAAEQARDRATHPARQELERSRRALAAHDRAAEVRAGRREVERPQLPPELAAAKAGVLVHVAFMRTGAAQRPDRTIFGEEPFGLAAAELAVQKVQQGDSSVPLIPACNILLGALHENGLHDEADRQLAELLPRLPARQRAEITRIAQRYAGIAKDADRRAARLRVHIGKLERAVGTQRTWTFSNDADQFLHDTLRQLRADILRFRDRDVVTVDRRRRWAQGLSKLEQDPSYRERWQKARAAIAEKIPGIALPIQHGLVPIGENPATGLFEFYHLRSAWRPATAERIEDIPVPSVADYDEHGGLALSERYRGIVFVLVSGGTFTIGAQDSNPSGMRYDPEGSRTEGWPQAVTLAPYFLAKHEVTQGQWLRLTDGERPSGHQIGYGHQGTNHTVEWQHPVEQVTWRMADRLAQRFGMVLPTEAQWEFACRAGTDTPYSTGAAASSLRGFANIHDQLAARLVGEPTDVDFEDGFRVTSPVGTFRPNAFGFHDMHGNVWEWCRDGGMNRPYPGIWAPGDGMSPEPGEAQRNVRGGSFEDIGREARSARRWSRPVELLQDNVGVRLARPVVRER